MNSKNPKVRQVQCTSLRKICVDKEVEVTRTLSSTESAQRIRCQEGNVRKRWWFLYQHFHLLNDLHDPDSFVKF